MLLNTERETVQTSGLGQGGNFTIAASAKAFEVLSSNLYQNKILAVIREITCNAADAHKMVGRSLSEIFIHLPTFSEPYFAVRDYGPGLSKKDVLTLYTTYFMSTKDGSDPNMTPEMASQQIGGFGLGSKAPFAVADQFTVTSWHGGMKRNYACFKDNGVPQVNVISETPSQEPTGLEVRVATKDANQWHREAANFFQWWSVLPRFNGGSTVTPLLHKDNIISASADKDDHGYPEWAIVRGLTGPTVFMGLVPYSLNITAIPDFDPSMAQAFSQLTIFLRFDVGALSISPSREALSYDKSTAALLRSKLSLIAKEITQTTQDRLAACKTMLEAREYAFKKLPNINHFGNVLLNMVKSGKLLWNGKRIYGGVDIDLCKDFGPLPEDKVTFSSLEKRSYSKSWRKQYIDVTNFRHNINHYDHDDNVDRYWLPQISSKTYRTIAHYYENVNKATTWKTVQFFTGSTLDKINAVFEEKGIPTLKDFADLPDPPKAVRTKAVSKVTKGYRITNTFGWERTEEELDLSDGGFYFEFFDGSPDPHSDKDIAQYCVSAGWIEPDVKFLGFRRSALATKTLTAQLTANKWARFNGKDWLAANVTPQQVYDKVLVDILIERTNLMPHRRMLAEAHKAGITFKNPDDQALAAYVAGVSAGRSIFYMSGGTAYSPLNIYMTPAQVAIIPQAIKDVTAKIKEYADFNHRHPLCPYLDLSRMADKTALYSYLNR